MEIANKSNILSKRQFGMFLHPYLPKISYDIN
jgi:hypothetical protein